MTDGRVAMDYELVMGETSPWRDLDSVTAEERKACEERIRAAHEAEPNKDFREIPLGWNDLCQYMTYLRLKTAKDRERKKHGLMESTHPPILPS